MEKHLKEIAKELRLIRMELKKLNKPSEPQKITVDDRKIEYFHERRSNEI